MKPAIVGFIVGFPVGKSGQPDKRELYVINELSFVCRKCRIPTTEETPGELESRRLTGGLE
jgi:hypothetical protein